VKLLLEILLSVFLHPIAAVLMWINLFGRTDLNDVQKIIWAITGLLWDSADSLFPGRRRRTLVVTA